MGNRYKAQANAAGDYDVIDTARMVPVSTGLDEDEASQAATRLNAMEESEKQQYAD